MTDIESLRRLTEAVETAGADIAPTYAEYVQLAFTIATDCGEAGREFFHRLCRTSAKYQREHSIQKLINPLTTRTDILQCSHYPAWGSTPGYGFPSCRNGKCETL